MRRNGHHLYFLLLAFMFIGGVAAKAQLPLEVTSGNGASSYTSRLYIDGQFFSLVTLNPLESQILPLPSLSIGRHNIKIQYVSSGSITGLSFYTLGLPSNSSFVLTGSNTQSGLLNNTNNREDDYDFDVNQHALHGIDISQPGFITPIDWQTISLTTYHSDFAIVQAYGGGKQGNLPTDMQPGAEALLAGANAVGLKTAAFCYLNFTSGRTGFEQVQLALNAIGAQRSSLSFLGIDVEQPDPQKFPPILFSDNNIKLVADAMAATWLAGLRPVIYTKRSDWQTIVNNSPELPAYPLWDTKYDGLDDLLNDRTSLTTAPAPFVAYGGWSNRLGKQYYAGGSGTGYSWQISQGRSINADFDVFDSTVFDVISPSVAGFPSLRPVQILTRSGSSIVVTGSLQNTGTPPLADAIATRITSATIITSAGTTSASAGSLPVRLNTIFVGQGNLYQLTLPGGGLPAGIPAVLKIGGIFGGGSFGFSLRVTLP